MADLDPASVIEAIAADQRLRVFAKKGRIETMPATGDGGHYPASKGLRLPSG
jgi:hypothetical protein